ncbi:hypothetical protein BpHYR1_050308 [Brachionus plicatilis]|uniref:Uncharacterized protein n=1 Tax=Brachionus plicatilis TaxID=10195 RepID=A0A3M7P4P9_BRAPC|nr:hypothetical protein BpHYR1_050308 [Brachionus plicatilis]
MGISFDHETLTFLVIVLVLEMSAFGFNSVPFFNGEGDVKKCCKPGESPSQIAVELEKLFKRAYPNLDKTNQLAPMQHHFLNDLPVDMKPKVEMDGELNRMGMGAKKGYEQGSFSQSSDFKTK